MDKRKYYERLFEKKFQEEEKAQDSRQEDPNETLRILVKKTKKLVAITSLVVAGAVATRLSEEAHQRIVGRNAIVQEFNDATAEFGVYNWSDGYKINHGNHYYEYQDGIKAMAKTARNAGMSDNEIYIGLSNVINERAAEEAIGEKLDSATKVNLYKQAYINQKYQIESKGASK